MPLPNCAPPWVYRPTFTPSGVQCSAPGYATHRARLTVIDTLSINPNEGLFFRSIQQSPSANLISVEMSGTLDVYYDNILQETYTFVDIPDLEAQVNSSSNYIEMPPLGYDIYDTRTTASPYGFSFGPDFLTGGSGGPTDGTGLASIRTGPERSIIIITTIEDDTGADTTPPASTRIQQWDGFLWISYCNLTPGACPGNGTC